MAEAQAEFDRYLGKVPRSSTSRGVPNRVQHVFTKHPKPLSVRS